MNKQSPDKQKPLSHQVQSTLNRLDAWVALKEKLHQAYVPVLNHYHGLKDRLELMVAPEKLPLLDIQMRRFLAMIDSFRGRCFNELAVSHNNSFIDTQALCLETFFLTDTVSSVESIQSELLRDGWVSFSIPLSRLYDAACQIGKLGSLVQLKDIVILERDLNGFSLKALDSVQIAFVGLDAVTQNVYQLQADSLIHFSRLTSDSDNPQIAVIIIRVLTKSEEKL